MRTTSRFACRPKIEALEERSLLAASSLLQLGLAIQTVAEDVGQVTLTVQRTGDTSKEASVLYATLNGTAVAKSDFAPVAGQLDFAAGEASKDIDVLILNDVFAEGTEFFKLKVYKPTDAGLGKIKKAKITITDNDGGGFNPQAIVQSVTFGGDHYHTIIADDGSLYYEQEHWLDLDLNGDATGDGEHDYPVSYTRNSVMSATAQFHLNVGIPEDETVLVRGNGPGGIDFAPTAVAVVDTATVNVNAVAGAPFADMVHYFDYFPIAWQVSFDSGATWTEAGQTVNPVYVTLGDPVGDMFHTLVRLGTVNAAGLADEAAVADAIFNEFTDLSVTRVENPVRMIYWKNNKSTATTSYELLHDGDGQCGSWAELYRDMLWDQGIASARKVEVTSANGSGFLVKDWKYHGGGSYPNQAPYVFEMGKDVTDSNGVPGQGNSNPPGSFCNHFIVEYGGRYYDPSYGSGPFNSQNDWEDASIDGFYMWAQINGQYKKLVKPNDAGVVETVFT